MEAVTEFNLDNEVLKSGNTGFRLTMKIEEDGSIIDFPNISTSISQWDLSTNDYPIDAVDPDPSSYEFESQFEYEDSADDEADDEVDDDSEIDPAICIFSFPVTRANLRELKIISELNYSEVRLVITYYDQTGEHALASHTIEGLAKSPILYGGSTSSTDLLVHTMSIFCQTLELNTILALDK